MAEMQLYAWWAVAAILVIVGLAGTVLPALPGVPFVFGGLLIAAWIGDFQRIGWPTLTVLALLTMLAIAADFAASMLGAKSVGASKQALIGAVIGSILGLFFGLIGVFIFPFIGAVAGEYMARGQLGQASKVGLATWLGILLGSIAKLSLAIAMVAIFVFAYWW